MKNNYLISKIAELTGTTKDAIRFYEKKGLFFAKIKSENNYRYYDDESLARLTFIKNCRNVGLSIQEIQILLEEMSQQKKNCNEVNHLIDRHISELDKKILQLQDFRSDLLEIRQKCNENTDIDHCLILKELSLKK